MPTTLLDTNSYCYAKKCCLTDIKRRIRVIFSPTFANITTNTCQLCCQPRPTMISTDKTSYTYNILLWHDSPIDVTAQEVPNHDADIERQNFNYVRT